MSGRYRTIFVGSRVQPDEALRKNLAAIRATLLGRGREVSATDPANLHFTLAFLGQPEVAEAKARFRECAATLASGVGGFEVSLVAVSGFHGRKHPARVIFAEPAPHPRLDALARAFRPMADQDAVLHLTLGRTRTEEAGVWARDTLLGPRALGTLQITQVALMANDGSGRYVDLDVVTL